MCEEAMCPQRVTQYTCDRDSHNLILKVTSGDMKIPFNALLI